MLELSVHVMLSSQNYKFLIFMIMLQEDIQISSKAWHIKLAL
jgi:hypothetical protein